MFSKRSTKLEYLDLGPEYYTVDEYTDCMDKLAKIGKVLGGNSASFKAINQLNFIPESILDVGCGGGAFTRLLAERYSRTTIVGIDTSLDAIRDAQDKYNSHSLKNLFFEHRNNPELKEPTNSFDVVIATLICHHLTDQQLVEFLKEACRISKRAVVINDLHRHPLAYYLFGLISPVLFNNRLIQHDGMLSIKRAFKRKDLEQYLVAAGITSDKWEISWNWAFRWIVTIKT